jgi:hypothetical protein
MSKRVLFLLITVFISVALFSQKIQYSEPDKQYRDSKFEIIGKLRNKIYIAPTNNETGNKYISVYDNKMKFLKKVELNNFSGKFLKIDFIAYVDFCYIFYQYEQDATIYTYALKLDAEDDKLKNIKLLDSTEALPQYNSRYTVIASENKTKILLFKFIVAQNQFGTFSFTQIQTSLYNDSLESLEKKFIPANLLFSETITGFQLDNNGNFFYTKKASHSSSSRFTLFIKAPLIDSFYMINVNIKNVYFSESYFKIDNYNKRYIVVMPYSVIVTNKTEKILQQKGLYTFVWDIEKQRKISSKTTETPDSLHNLHDKKKTKDLYFNDYTIKNIIIKKNGSFIVACESVAREITRNAVSTSTLPNPINTTPNIVFSSTIWYYADNIALFTVDTSGNITAINSIRKSQSDVNTTDYISFGMLNTGTELTFLFNEGKRNSQTLTQNNINANAEVNRFPFFTEQNPRYRFKPSLLKQISSREVIIPYTYKNYICFAKVDF